MWLVVWGSWVFNTNGSTELATIYLRMQAVMHCCKLNVAKGSIVSNLILELTNKRLRRMQLGSLLCQPAIQSFQLLTVAGHLLL